MPIYDYACASCGGFAAFVPVARFDQAEPCPGCGAAAPRAGLSVPMLAGMERSRFAAHAVNERSADAPERSARSGRHPASCKCCRPKPTGAAAKSFPGTRPWMISH